MTSARESFRDPPLILSDGRLHIWPDGEWMAFYGPNSCSWTAGTLDARDLAALKAYLPTVVDNVTDVYEEVNLNDRLHSAQPRES